MHATARMQRPRAWQRAAAVAALLVVCWAVGACGADPYRALGVSKGASDAEIKTAFRRLALKYHPDKVCGRVP